MKRTGMVLLCLVLAGGVLLVGGPAGAGPGSSQTAIVSLGDSFISGEAGRWSGNSLNPFHNRNGTDRAAYNCTWWGECDYDPHRVYGTSYDNGCDRSDVAHIKSAVISVNQKINLACSGARTQHIWRASQGGQVFKGEAPQADQLASVAAAYNVKLVVLTITANDLGFSDHVIDCTVAWIADAGPCNAAEQAEMNAAMPAAKTGLRKAIDEIRAVMAGAGYSATQWKFVIAGYSSPIPTGPNIRYQPESNDDRWWSGGCPFYDADANWAKNTATPFIVNGMKQVAAEKGVQFLDVRDALNGHEVCHKSSSLVGGSGPNSAVHEWVRWVNTGCCQGDAQESLHPNAFGQRALGKCVQLMYAKTSGNWTCKNTPGQGYTAMTLTQTT
jgi:hypothetical protein